MRSRSQPSSSATGSASAYAQTHVNGNQDLKDTGLWPASDPNQPQNGASNNGHEQNWRPRKGAATGSWGSGLGNPPNFPAPDFPNVWLRLQRRGTSLHGYSGTDGVNWTDQGTTQLTDQQNFMYVGPSLSVESGNIWNGGSNPFNVWDSPFDPTYDRLYLAQFRNFGDVSTIVQPTISISRSGTSFVINYTGTLYSSSTANGTYGPVSGASSPYTVPSNTSIQFYRASSP